MHIWHAGLGEHCRLKAEIPITSTVLSVFSLSTIPTIVLHIHPSPGCSGPGKWFKKGQKESCECLWFSSISLPCLINIKWMCRWMCTEVLSRAVECILGRKEQGDKSRHTSTIASHLRRKCPFPKEYGVIQSSKLHLDNVPPP